MDPRSYPRSHDFHAPPVSRTYQYKKVTKPLLERKRRARINRCLDELKELMVGALEAEGENVSKLEKADILELTVRHLHSLGRPRDAVEDAHRFQAGFSQCASEACQFLLSLPGLDARVGRRLVSHLGQCVAGPLSVQVAPQSRSCYSPPVSPAPYTPHSGCSSQTSTSPPSCHSSSPRTTKESQQGVVLSSTPSVHDLSRPMTGLLMTVPGQAPQAHGSSSSRPPRPDEDHPEDLSMWRPW